MRLRRRASWHTLTFESFGVPVELRLADPDLEQHVHAILPPDWRSCGSSDSAGRFELRHAGTDGYGVSVGDYSWLEQATLDVALGMLDAQIRQFVATTATDWIFVHAGVVADDGRALVVPGESFCGKTTLVAALVRAGATYYSDEYAVLDMEGRVHPYPRRLSIRGEDGGDSEERHVAELGGIAGEQSAGVAMIVATRYKAGAEWNPTRLSRGQGTIELMANTVPAQQRPQESLRALTRATDGATVLQSDRGEAGPVAMELLALLGAS